MHAKLRRIAIFAEPSPLFVNTVMGLKAGFEELGVDVHAGWPPLPGNVLPSFLANYRPDAVLEINRSRDHIKDCDEDFLHLCWLQDFQYGGHDLLADLGGSGLTYLMVPPDMFGVDLSRSPAWRHLWPGFNTATGDRAAMPGGAASDGDGPGSDPLCALSFIGHMYAPPPDAAMAATLMVGGVECGRLSELIDAFLVSDFEAGHFSLASFHAFLSSYFRRFGVDFAIADVPADRRYLFDEFLIRIKERIQIAERMLAVSPDVRLYGSGGWSQWRRLAPYYHGFLNTPRELAAVYRGSALNVHSGIWPLHFRVIDCLGCGGAAMINRVHHPEARRFFYEEFEAGVDFVDYTPESFVEDARRMLRDRQALERMRRAGQRKILARHTCRHRAEQIMRDLNDL
ncbi:glycosyltransferase family protein [Azospirillum rugosum]|uniref:Spore protein YkvP/CgeB glycosyl transferase-like domain-containing protein n=1 Tax=Azospirillum rugosum TaxID=416170 RepID=A0ABS4SP34_9PROT|nr:glycosyltransferase [Azospirillum rugosum]MBP2294315.1 hypothetical protein [Azospirillum rugosum]MDQ0527650.1 hypothetical protein [Azospirillum rugosum]